MHHEYPKKSKEQGIHKPLNPFFQQKHGFAYSKYASCISGLSLREKECCLRLQGWHLRMKGWHLRMKGWQFPIIGWPTALEGYSPLLKKPALRVADSQLRKKNALDKEKKYRIVKKES